MYYVLGLLEVVERCLEGIEDVANPNDVGHAVDDVLHLVENAADVHLDHDGLLDLDADQLLVDLLDDLFVQNDIDDLQDLVHDDTLDFPGQPDDVFLFLYDDFDAADVNLVLLALDDNVDLDVDQFVDVSTVGLDVDLLFCQPVDVLEEDVYLHSHNRCRSASC